MTDAPLLVLDTTGLEPVQPSGFLPPSQRTSYSDPLVQDFLAQAFGSRFPRLESVEANTARYRHDHPAEDSFADYAAAESIDDIPQPEIMRLLQGWITLRRIVMEATAPEGVRSLLMNLRIPDPRVAPHFYRVNSPANEERKLYVLIGFEGPSAPSVTLEEGIAAMLNVKPSQLESLLATSMAPSKSTPQATSPEVATTNAIPVAKSSGSKNIALLCSSAALLLFAFAIVWKLNERPVPAPTSAPIGATQAAVSTPAPPSVSSAPLSIVSPEPESASAATQSKPAPLPTLDAMNTGMPPEETPSRATSQQRPENVDLNLMAR